VSKTAGKIKDRRGTNFYSSGEMAKNMPSQDLKAWKIPFIECEMAIPIAG